MTINLPEATAFIFDSKIKHEKSIDHKTKKQPSMHRDA